MPEYLAPGVCVEEVPGVVRNIEGVATSIALFAGWTPRGPTNAELMVSGFADFEREFGGLDARSLLGYAVQQFFANGGHTAWIMRIAGAKAPAGREATLAGATGLAINLSDAEQGRLNPRAINALRSFPGTGAVAWGARTLHGQDERASEWKYIPVRRLALHIEESLYRGTRWAVFEPNDEPLWAQIRLHVGAFMHELFRLGAFQGRTDRDAYFVKCDRDTTTQADVGDGFVNIAVGFAPLKPAEFVTLVIRQAAGHRGGAA